MRTQTKIQVGDLVYIVSPKQEDIFPNQTKGVVFEEKGDSWYKIYITWKQETRIQTYPDWMLRKV